MISITITNVRGPTEDETKRHPRAITVGFCLDGDFEGRSFEADLEPGRDLQLALASDNPAHWGCEALAEYGFEMTRDEAARYRDAIEHAARLAAPEWVDEILFQAAK